MTAGKEVPLIDAAAATHAAAGFLQQIYAGAEGIRVEELEIPDDRQDLWKVTLSFLDRANPPTSAFAGNLTQLLNPTRDRIYKTFDIDTETGAVKRMIIRNLE